LQQVYYNQYMENKSEAT